MSLIGRLRVLGAWRWRASECLRYGVHMAVWAGSMRHGLVVVAYGSRKLGLDFSKMERDAMSFLAAYVAEPDKGVELIVASGTLDNNTPRVRGTPRRVRHVGRHEHDLAFVDPMLLAYAIDHQVDPDRALELHKHFVEWIDMEIAARIGTVDDHKGLIAVLPDHLVRNWWLECVGVVDDPLVKVQWAGAGRIRHESSQEDVDG
jgi:hypothetical protein